MKNIRFEFNCNREVPFYGHLCNQYLHSEQFDLCIGQQGNLYFIEAQGKQTELENLADTIASDFLLSTSLEQPQIRAIENITGTKTLLPPSALDLEYCQHCQPKFADNQSANFGDVNYPCQCCNAHLRLPASLKEIKLQEIKNLVRQLEELGELTIEHNGIKQHISFKPIAKDNTEQRACLMICNPNNLNAHFSVTNQQVLALSSIEKPRITARPIAKHPRLEQALYEICFAKSRLLLVICEILRQKGIDFIYVENSDNPQMVQLNGQWVRLNTAVTNSIHRYPAHREPLHDNAQQYAYDSMRKVSCLANCKNHVIKVKVEHDKQQPDPNLIQQSKDAATCALHASCIKQKKPKHKAVIYFSDKFNNQILTLDAKQNTDLFFEFPVLPNNGYEIVHQLELSAQKPLIEKFKQQFPEDYINLLSLKLTSPTNNVQSLWAIAAIFLGAVTAKPNINALSKQQLSDYIIAKGMCHKGANAPRIDFPLTRGEAFRSLNWCKTLGSIISFRLAEADNIEKLAFGMHDSLADFICNWIEHLDQNISIKTVLLSGSGFANELLGQRLSLRLGKNFLLECNPEQDLEGVNLAVGALYLKRRRHV
ncbi:NiFe hydrogenase assembly chaperone HyaE [Shewanella sairae]|uniref:NiFe hydrogenase assembly chaperone HyaE n=1 Tax=Shewanella sairae TaxID=190310 RepID=A0ABQ4PR02_9GAMM|nr:NiFe hydrogenase [Shewanella sairae]MCL1129832.1 NiFe hydrogenase [Shewanella sairae]GIU51812.1 NiFe hydrogenase assembly chaperone HyaE [Shewanella sairae]